MNADQKSESLFQVIPNGKLCFFDKAELEAWMKNVRCFFDKAELEAWMKNVRVASQAELDQQAQKYIIR